MPSTPEQKNCSRCNTWHQRLFHVWDNQRGRDTLICLTCIAELTEDRIDRFIPWTVLSLIASRKPQDRHKLRNIAHRTAKRPQVGNGITPGSNETQRGSGEEGEGR